MEFAEKLTLIHFGLSLHGLELTDPTLKLLTFVKESRCHGNIWHAIKEVLSEIYAKII